MITWTELLSTALVGTDRRPLSTVEGDSALGLLDEAVVHALRRRAGVPSATDVPAPTPTAADSVPLPKVGATTRLGALLAGSAGFPADLRHELIREWLATAVSANRRVPPELLPELLNHGRGHRDLRPLVVAAGGARAGWLAGQRAEWAYLTATADSSGGDDVQVWHEGSPGQRLGYLTLARQADPDAARELLAADWATLPPAERGDLLGALETGLGPADEEFLERALDDRTKKVRTTAAELLQDLPDSAYGRRQAERARAAVRFDAGALHVTPPAECDKAMRRDGIEPKPPAGTGERAWWLEEILARTPLSTWTAYAPDPAAFLALPIADDWAVPVQRGLARAAAERNDPTWAAALIATLTAQTGGRKAARIEEQVLTEALYSALDPADVVALTLASLAARRAGAGRKAPTGLDRLLGLCPTPWPAELAEAVLAAVVDYAAETGDSRFPRELWYLAPRRLPVGYATQVSELARQVAQRAAATPPEPPPSPDGKQRTPAQLAAAQRQAERVDTERRSNLDHLARVLRYRHDMIQELS